MPYLVQAADGTTLEDAGSTYGRAETSARLYTSAKRVETRVIEWCDTDHGRKSRELWCSSDYPASVRFPATPGATAQP